MAKIVNGAERGRHGKWIVDYRDPVTGKRKWITKDTREEAKKALGEILSGNGHAGYCAVDTEITLGEYGDEILAGRAAFIKASTVTANQTSFKSVKDLIGGLKIKDLTPGVIVRTLESLKAKGLENSTVKYKLEVLSVILNRAKLDGIIAHNPATGIVKRLNLSRDKGGEEVKAFTLEQRGLFLEAAETSPNKTLFRFLLGTGARIGEALALRVGDISGQTAVIDERILHGELGTPKSGVARTVDLTQDLAGRLKTQVAKVTEQALAQGRKPDFLFCDEDGKPLVYETVRYDFARVLKRAGLPAHFTPHCTRHTYATLLLSNGESIQYVQQQLGHTSITLTVDIYGKWIPLKSSGVQEKIEHGFNQEIARAAHSRS